VFCILLYYVSFSVGVHVGINFCLNFLQKVVGQLHLMKKIYMAVLFLVFIQKFTLGLHHRKSMQLLTLEAVILR